MKQFFLTILAASAVVSTAHAQPNTQSMSGVFVLAEEGSGVSQPIAALAILKFNPDGTVAGFQIHRGPGSTLKSSAQGTYSLNGDGTGVLALATQTMPADNSDPMQSTANYYLRWSKTRGIAAIRSDTGFYTIGTLALADPGPVKGGFILAERGNGLPYAALGQLNFDGTSAITGSERIAALGFSAAYNVTGSYATGLDGFGSFTLNIPSTDADGNVSFSPANYVFAATGNQIFAIRTDGNSAVVSTLTSMQ